MTKNVLMRNVLSFYQRYYRNLTAWGLKGKRSIKVSSRIMITMTLFLMPFLFFMLPTALKLILLFLVIIPYIRFSIAKTKHFTKLYKRIKSYIFIGVKSTEVDLRARLKLLKRLFSISFSYLIIILTILNWLFDTNLRTDITPQWLNKDMFTTAGLGIIFYSFTFLVSKRKRILIPLLSLTSPFISLSLLLQLIHIANMLLSKVTDTTYSSISSNALDGYIYLFLESGTDNKFALINFTYSFTFQLIFVFIQPTYKLERSRLALETIAVFYGAVSVIGLLLAAPISNYLYQYLINIPEGPSLLFYAGISASNDFKNFYESTLKFVILPFSLGTTIPILMMKLRESNSKSRGQAIFDKACLNPNMESNRMLSLLREALYYGGGSIRSSIYSHHILHTYIPFLNVLHLKRTTRRVKLWNLIRVRYERYISKIKENALSLHRTYVKVLDDFQKDIAAIPTIIALSPIKFWSKTIFIFLFTIVLLWVLLSIQAHNFLYQLNSYYFSLYGVERERAYASLCIIYFFYTCVYFMIKTLANKKKNDHRKFELYKFITHVVILLITTWFVFFTNMVYSSLSNLWIFPLLWHINWFLKHSNESALTNQDNTASPNNLTSGK